MAVPHAPFLAASPKLGPLQAALPRLSERWIVHYSIHYWESYIGSIGSHPKLHALHYAGIAVDTYRASDLTILTLFPYKHSYPILTHHPSQQSITLLTELCGARCRPEDPS